MDVENDINNSLYALGLKINEVIDKLKESHKLRITPYERIRVRKMDYKMGSFEYDWENIEYFDYYDWSVDLFGSVQDEIKKLQEFEFSAEALSKRFPLTLDIIKNYGLSNFIRHLMHNLPNSADYTSLINECITLYINDYQSGIDKTPLKWNVQLFLGNMEFQSENTWILSNSLYIMRPNDEYFLLARPKRPIDEFERSTGKGFYETCIIKFSLFADKDPSGLYPKKVSEEIESWVDVFRLYNVANITIKHIAAFPESLWYQGSNDLPESPFDNAWKGKLEYSDTSDFKCRIREEEIDTLNTFAEKIKGILDTISQQAYLKGSHIELAFHRYKDALLRSKASVNRMVSAVSALEALLGEPSGDITYKISTRTSVLLTFFGFHPIDTFSKLKLAYDIRSRLLHGEPLDDKHLEFSKQHIHEILEFTRICLLISLQLKELLKKKILIQKIDHSLVDISARKDLEELIKGKVTIPLSKFRYCIEYTQYSKKLEWLN